MDTDLSRYFSSAPDQSSKRPQTSNKASYSGNLSFRFPSYRNILWDRRPVDDLIFEIKAERFLPTMVVPIHILEQAVQYARMSCDGWSGNFIGRYKSESDSYLVVIDNFLPYCPDKKSYSDLVHIHTGALSFESIVRDAITELQSDEFPCVSSFIQAFCQINETPEGLCLHGHLVVPTSSLRFSLIKPLRILNNPLGEALQKGNLSLPLNSTFQFGYLTLDQVRNAVPLQFNDALAFKWPLIGIWIFGQKSDVSIESVHVWTSCMRFLYNESVKDRVSPEPMTFLVLIVHPGHHNCEFFECQAIPSNNVLRLYDFGMRSLCLASQAKTELSFRWSIDVTDAHHEEFQGCLGSFGALDSINDCSSSSAERLRGTQRSTSVPPLDVSSNYREHLSNYRSSSVSPHATSVAPTLEVPTNAPQPLESAETLMIGVHDKHELLDKDLPADASSIASKSHSEDISSTKHESYFPVKSHSSSSAHTSVVNHHQSNLDCDAVSLGGLSIKLNTYEQDLKDLSDCSKASHLKFLEYHKRQFELLQEQVNSLRETFESRLKHICCCSTKIHEFHNDNVKLPPTKGESSRPSEEISRSVMASNSSQSVIVSSRSQAVETVETSSSSYQQPTDNTSSGSSADAPSVRSAISSSKSSRRQSIDHPVNDDGCRLASIAVEIKTSSIGSTSTASGLPTPERSASSHADSRVVDSVSESSWAHDHQDNTSPHEAQVGKRSFMECKKTDPSPFAELIEPLTDDHYASDNETVDIPRIQFASFEDSSDDDLDEISRRYLNDKLSSGPGSEDTTTGALHTSKYLLSFPDKN